MSTEVSDLIAQIAELTEENKDLEATVSSLEIQAQETRETFLRVGHGGQSKHLAGLHENAVIAALENENKDLFYELEKKKSQKWQCTQSLTKSFADAATSSRSRRSACRITNSISALDDVLRWPRRAAPKRLCGTRNIPL